MRYIVLLRGINVSGKHKILMKDFITILLAHPNITTAKSYIQSGNFLVDSNLKTNNEINLLFTSIILKNYNYDISAFSYTIDEFKNIFNNYPYEIDYKTNYISFLSEVPKLQKISELKDKEYPNDIFDVVKSVIYVKYGVKLSDSKLNNNYFEKQLQIIATTRNIRTIGKLVEIAEKK